MSVDQLIHFNSNEEYERSVFQFVQMTGNMSIKEAKHAMDGLVEQTLAKRNFQTYRCGGGRNRQGSVLYVFDTGYRFQNSRERIFAHTLKNMRRRLLRPVHPAGKPPAGRHPVENGLLAYRGHRFQRYERAQRSAWPSGGGGAV